MNVITSMTQLTKITSSNNDTNNIIQIVATEMSESEICEKEITCQQNGYAIIKVTYSKKAMLKALERSNPNEIKDMFASALTNGEWNWEDLGEDEKDYSGTILETVSQAYNVCEVGEHIDR